MLKKTSLLLLALLFTSSIFGAIELETDNYITWDRELKDSGAALNGFVADEINEALEVANSKRKIQSCEQVTFRIAKRFRAISPFWHPLEDWLWENLDEDALYPHEKKWMKKSIYRNPYRFYLRYVQLAPNIQIGGFYFGTDKLSHFSSTGRRYFAHYLKMIKKGMSDLEAQKSAIRYGLDNEATFLGTWSSGVFSYGDMEANYQGFLFYKRMCMNQADNYLAQDEDGTWRLQKAPDLNDYVSAYWDETFNLSYRMPRNWEKSSEIIKELYCSKDLLKYGVSRMERYKLKPHTSFSLEYIKELQDQDYYRAPKPQELQSFTELCE